jgi:hypothetical protein
MSSLMKSISQFASWLMLSLLTVSASAIDRPMTPTASIIGPSREFSATVLRTVSDAQATYVISYSEEFHQVTVHKFDQAGNIVGSVAEQQLTAAELSAQFDQRKNLIVSTGACTLFSIDTQTMRVRFRRDVRDISVSAKRTPDGGPPPQCNGIYVTPTNEIAAQVVTAEGRTLHRFAQDGRFLGRQLVLYNGAPISVRTITQFGNTGLIWNCDVGCAVFGMNDQFQVTWKFNLRNGQSNPNVIAVEQQYAYIRSADIANGDNLTFTAIDISGNQVATVDLPPTQYIDRRIASNGTIWFELLLTNFERKLFSWRPGNPPDVVASNSDLIGPFTPLDGQRLFGIALKSPNARLPCLYNRSGAIERCGDSINGLFVSALAPLSNEKLLALAQVDLTFKLHYASFLLSDLTNSIPSPLLTPTAIATSEVLPHPDGAIIIATTQTPDAVNPLIWSSIDREGQLRFSNPQFFKSIVVGATSLFGLADGQITCMRFDGQLVWTQASDATRLLAAGQGDVVWAARSDGADFFYVDRVGATGILRGTGRLPSGAGLDGSSVRHVGTNGNLTVIACDGACVASRYRPDASVVWQQPMPSGHRLLTSSDDAVFKHERSSSMSGLYRRYSANSSIIWQLDAPSINCPLASYWREERWLHESCHGTGFFEPTMHWMTIDRNTGAGQRQSLDLPSEYGILGMRMGDNSNRWIHTSDGHGLNQLLEVSTNGSLLNTWKTPVDGYFIGNYLWARPQTGFLALDASIPGNGSGVRIFRASSEYLLSTGFETD